MKSTLATPVKSPPDGNGDLRMHQFTVDEYHRMIEAGILTTSHRVELLNGWIVDKMPQNPPHPTAVGRLYRRLVTMLSAEEWVVRSQCPVTLATSEPEPDIAIARGPDTRYKTRHPGPRDIHCLMEVSESSLLYDREEKGPVYAAARIPHYWLVNLVTRCVEIFVRPYAGRHPAYRAVKVYGIDDVIALDLDGKQFGEIAVRQLVD